MRRLVATALAAVLVAGCAGMPDSRTPAPAASTVAPTSRPGASAMPSPAAGQSGEPSPTPMASPVPTESPVPTLEQLVGQKLMVAMGGTAPSRELLRRIRDGEVGGVILFGANVGSPAELARLTAQLHAAAAEGGQPPLLVAVDQEGGIVKRLDWAPPDRTPPEMGADGRAATARAEGEATGRALAGAGVDVNLAPVLDVPASPASFLARQGRTWSADADVTADLGAAFAAGLLDAGVVPVAKHFPGIGRAERNTDLHVVTIAAPAADLEVDLRPFRAAIDAGVPMVMLSNAVHRAYDPRHAAGWSRAIAGDLLRGELGFGGVTITDALEAAARTRGVPTSRLATLAAAAGVDVILLADLEPRTSATYAELLRAAGDGTIPREALEASYARILALKAAFAAP